MISYLVYPEELPPTMASRKGLTNARILRLGLGVPNATGFDVMFILVPGLFCWPREVGIQIRD